MKIKSHEVSTSGRLNITEYYLFQNNSPGVQILNFCSIQFGGGGGGGAGE